ncbi:MAG: TSUP family transporter [Pseudomonadota bacterium]
MDLTTFAMLISIGALGGAWNAAAGGATIFTFPALILAGLPPMTANATNFVALLPANLAALPAYRRELSSVGRLVAPAVAVALVAGALGAAALSRGGEAFFVEAIPWLILAAVALFALGDRLRETLEGSRLGLMGGYALLLVASLYGGYFGAGAGIAILAALQAMGHADFHVANALKNALAAALTLAGIAVYGIDGLIAWPEAAAMTAGALAGGYFGARMARRIDGALLRRAIVVFGLGLSLYYFLG